MGNIRVVRNVIREFCKLNGVTYSDIVLKRNCVISNLDMRKMIFPKGYYYDDAQKRIISENVIIPVVTFV